MSNLQILHKNAPMHTKAIFERVSSSFLFSFPLLIFLFFLFVYIVAFVSRNVTLEKVVGIKRRFFLVKTLIIGRRETLREMMLMKINDSGFQT